MRKIAFIGGPASGKTTVLNILSKTVCPEYKDKTVFVSEAAMDIIRSTPESVISEMSPLVFQFEVFKLQTKKESELTERFDYAFCDRGVADAFVYLSEEDAKKLTTDTKEDMLQRYDVAIFFFGCETNFTNDATARRESDYTDIKRLEQKSWEVWREHKNLFVAMQHKTVYRKALNVADTLNWVLGVEIFDLDLIRKMEAREN